MTCLLIFHFKVAYFNPKVTTFFSGLKLGLLTTLLLLSVEIKLMASTLLLGFWVPEPLWLSSSISNCYQPLRIPSHTSPFLFIPVSWISLWKLKHQSWNSTTDTKGKPGSMTSSQRWEERRSGLHSRASPSQGPWADKVTAHLQTSALSTGIPRVQKAGETEPFQHCASVRKWAPRTSPQFTRHL